MTEPQTDTDVGLTRRRLVQAGGAATAALYLGGLTGTAAAGGVPSYLSRSSYAALTDTPFTAVTATGATVTLRLTEVADLARARQEPSFVGRDDAFALAFSGPRDVVLQSGIHELYHPSFGAFSVFIAPVENAAAEQHYEVVVDRSVRLASAANQAPEPMERTNTAATAPAVAGAAGATSSAETAAKAKAKAKGKAKTKKPVKLLQAAYVARRGGALTCDVRLAPGRGVISVRGTLLRDGVEVARAARMVRGRAGVRLNLREMAPVAAGGYDLRVTVTDRGGKRHVSTRRVTVR
ncbi:MAG: hypothetical protein JWM93_2105 [Frankiales bacterium]|nr:hypothetical protein [Frankiales bacterium]MCW3013419.1 hypothetical protein [Solirubrobacterales bacterium]